MMGKVAAKQNTLSELIRKGSAKRKRVDDSSSDDSDTEFNEFSFNNHQPSLNHTIHVRIFTGKTFLLKVKLSDTIGYVKTMIQRKECICTNQQVLILDDTVLEDIDILSDFNIEKKDTVLTLIRKSVGLMGIFVKKILPKPYPERTFYLEVKPSDTISNVKHKIYSMYRSYPVEEQRLIYNDTLLDDSGTLADFHIKKDFTLTLLKSGGWINIFIKTSFIKTSTDETISQRVKPTYTISKLKDKIQYSVRVPPHEQVLIFNDMVLEDNSTLDDFCIGRDSTLTLLRKSSGRNKIFVKTHYAKIITLNFNPLDTIENVKTMVERKEDIPCDKQRLIFGGRLLEDRNTLIHYNIDKESTIYLLIR